MKLNYIYIFDSSIYSKLYKLEDLEQLLGVETKYKILKKNSIVDQWNTAIGEVFLKILASIHLRKSINKIEILKEESGKPYIKDLPYLYPAVSHSKNKVVCTLSDYPIGLDIEYMSDNFHLIKPNYFMNKNEEEMLNKFEYERKKKYFFLKWTRFECVVKYNSCQQYNYFSELVPFFESRILNNYVLSIYSSSKNKYIYDINLNKYIL